ncbi:MAG: Re/Si-specific NAD(P)(+) transhydrogenase subunit alpha [Flaviflexus sp.]|nr:Re/Si-specific NAD(P)(+) transhydrogenase subunit alpha [Flaviflexus sp.]
MRIGVPVEPTGPNLVSATPDTVGKLHRLGYDVVVERGAGEGASFTDDMYEQAGATLVDGDEAWAADIVTTLDPPEDAERLARGAMLISRLAPARSPELLEKLRERGVTAIAMDAIPRISRAQSMDVLSSQANIAGYRAVIEAANVFGRLFTGQVTAAGKVPPATVYIIGAGVAGLAAIGTANSMGAIVEATDVRAEVAEQVESMGATFVPIPAPAQESADGYAKEMSDEQAAAAERLYRERAAHADIVITTANIPGRTAPILLDEEAVAGMKPGSVIVDMAAGSGGNCELTQPGEIITVHGVTIIGLTELARRLPAQSSQLFGQNIVNFLGLITPDKDGQAKLDLEDVICRQVTCTQDGETLWPPPPVQVSAAPTSSAPTPPAASEMAGPAEPVPAKGQAKLLWAAIAACLGAALVLVTPLAFIGHYMVLALAIIVGFYVITNVTHALHTSLMSVTNAISGIIIVGALLQVGHSNWLVTVLSFIAITIASINVFGGFTVTHRMLAMFRKA